jgi:hypothetical protein
MDYKPTAGMEGMARTAKGHQDFWQEHGDDAYCERIASIFEGGVARGDGIEQSFEGCWNVYLGKEDEELLRKFARACKERVREIQGAHNHINRASGRIVMFWRIKNEVADKKAADALKPWWRRKWFGSY